MADMVPAVPSPTTAVPARSLAAPLFDREGGPILTRIGTFAAQDQVRKMVPAFIAVSAIGIAALAWSQLAPAPQRMLYSGLDDQDRAAVTQLLDSQGINWNIDNATGVLTVDEEDFYKARMLAATDTSIGAPESSIEMMDSLPLGASRTMEGERLRIARERELTLTIGQIDGVDAVRVHLAEAERSAFVRENIPPSASVMVSLGRGRQLSDSQVRAIVNLVAASVPGMSIDSVRVVDQAGRLLSDPRSNDGDRLDLQARIEEKLRSQVAHLLTPMIGEGNFSSEIQVDLDMDEVTRASESYDKDGALRSENLVTTQSANGNASGIPGALTNTPPPTPQAEEGAPEGGQNEVNEGASGNTDSSSSRRWELGREVSVANSAPGAIKRLSVAVALSGEAIEGANEAKLAELKTLISAAVGANDARGDQVAVMVSEFEPIAAVDTPFYAEGWFARLLRIGGGILVALLIIGLGARPLLKSLRKRDEADDVPVLEGPSAEEQQEKDEISKEALALVEAARKREQLTEKLGLARNFIDEQPENAFAAFREMLNEKPDAALEAN